MMSKKKKRRKKQPPAPARVRRQNTPLAGHQRHKKTLTPPLLALGGVQAVSYARDFLPDLIWIAAMFEQDGSWDAAYEPLDVIEEIAPPEEGERDGSKFLALADGRISTFGYVPEEKRADVRSALHERTPWALSDELGHALALYPDCPASWLYDDWRKENSADPEVGLRFLKRIISEYGDRETDDATHLRMVVIARRLKAGRLHVPREIGEEWAKYPPGLDDDGRKRVQASMRAMYNLEGNDEFAPPAARPWAEHFWRQNWKVSACEFLDDAFIPPAETDEREEDLPEIAPRITVERVHTAWTEAVRTLERGLADRELRAELDLWDPTPDEVRLGLASRVMRLVHELIEDPNLWTATGAAHFVRAVIDTRIVVAWLLKKDDPALYEQFKQYGLGKTKLYKLHLEEYMEASGSSELEELREQLDREVNAEILEEFQRISFGGTFAGLSIREMAEEADMKPVYTLNYQPLSSEAHGEWGSLNRHDLKFCTNPLHRFHRLGRFEPFPDRGSIALLHMAFGFARDAVEDVFDSYRIETSDLFDACVDAFNAALAPRPAA